jgi:hypothetical protein
MSLPWLNAQRSHGRSFLSLQFFFFIDKPLNARAIPGFLDVTFLRSLVTPAARLISIVFRAQNKAVA